MELHSISAVARELKVDRRVVSWLIDMHGIETHAIPTNGNARGLSPAGLAKIRRATKAPAKVKAAS